jgi:translation initiation factor 1A
MPNKTGGKNYKKSKHASEDSAVMHVERQDGQQYGRVIRVLGGGNMLVYCNDNKERICHIRGAIRKRVWINLGDVVLVSLRDLGENRGDILAKIDPKSYSHIRKEAGINLTIFNNLEGGGGGSAMDEEDGIVFDSAPAAGGAGAAGADSDESDMDIETI